MLPDEDDDNPAGSPPDPGSRPWRHPSELSRTAEVVSVPASRSHLLGGMAATAGIALFAVATFGLIGSAVGDDNETLAGAFTSLGTGNGGWGSSSSVSASTPAERPTADKAAAADKTTAAEERAAGTNSDESTTSESSPPKPSQWSWPLMGDNDHAIAVATVIDPNGLAVTSRTAVGDRTEVEAHTASGPTTLSVVASDALSDLAVLTWGEGEPSLDTPAWHATLDGNLCVDDGSEEPTCGAVVNPDAVARSIDDVLLYGLIETSMVAEAATAGTALVDADGKPVAVTVVTNAPLLMAVPLETATSIADQLLQGGSVVRSSIGIEAVAPTDGEGVIVRRVDETGPAGSRLEPDDRILAVDGTTIDDTNHLVQIIRPVEPGSTITVTIERRGRIRTVEVATERLADDPSG